MRCFDKLWSFFLIFWLWFVSIFIFSIIPLPFLSLCISSDLNPFDLAFMNGRVEIIDLNFAFELVTLYAPAWSFSSLITYVNTLMDDSLLFLLALPWRLSPFHLNIIYKRIDFKIMNYVFDSIFIWMRINVNY